MQLSPLIAIHIYILFIAFSSSSSNNRRHHKYNQVEAFWLTDSSFFPTQQQPLVQTTTNNQVKDQESTSSANVVAPPTSSSAAATLDLKNVPEPTQAFQTSSSNVAAVDWSPSGQRMTTSSHPLQFAAPPPSQVAQATCQCELAWLQNQTSSLLNKWLNSSASAEAWLADKLAVAKSGSSRMTPSGSGLATSASAATSSSQFKQQQKQHSNKQRSAWDATTSSASRDHHHQHHEPRAQHHHHHQRRQQQQRNATGIVNHWSPGSSWIRRRQAASAGSGNIAATASNLSKSSSGAAEQQQQLEPRAGPPGPKGETGARGDKGDRGERGPSGLISVKDRDSLFDLVAVSSVATTRTATAKARDEQQQRQDANKMQQQLDSEVGAVSNTTAAAEADAAASISIVKQLVDMANANQNGQVAEQQSGEVVGPLATNAGGGGDGGALLAFIESEQMLVLRTRTGWRPIPLLPALIDSRFAQQQQQQQSTKTDRQSTSGSASKFNQQQPQTTLPRLKPSEQQQQQQRQLLQQQQQQRRRHSTSSQRQKYQKQRPVTTPSRTRPLATTPTGQGSTSSSLLELDKVAYSILSSTLNDASTVVEDDDDDDDNSSEDDVGGSSNSLTTASATVGREKQQQPQRMLNGLEFDSVLEDQDDDDDDINLEEEEEEEEEEEDQDDEEDEQLENDILEDEEKLLEASAKMLSKKQINQLMASNKALAAASTGGMKNISGRWATADALVLDATTAVDSSIQQQPDTPLSSKQTTTTTTTSITSISDQSFPASSSSSSNGWSDDRLKLRIAALNEPFSGNVHGIRGADFECRRNAARANIKGSFKAFLASGFQNLNEVVRTNAHKYSVVNLRGETLANSWQDLFKQPARFLNPLSRILSFDGRQIATDSHWPNKLVWHGATNRAGYRDLLNNCDGWHSDSLSKFGLATPIHSPKAHYNNQLKQTTSGGSKQRPRRKRFFANQNNSTSQLLEYANGDYGNVLDVIGKYPCRMPLIVLCIETTGQKHQEFEREKSQFETNNI